MALNFTTTLTTAEGIEVANAYGRVAVADQVAGDRLDTIVEVYASEAAFLAGSQRLSLTLKQSASFPYDRAVDGSDILDLAHDALITHLAGEGVTATKNL